MKQHVIKICQTAYYELKRINSIRRYLKENAAKLLVTSCVLSRLDYWNSLLMGQWELCNSTNAESPKYCCTPHSQSSTPSELHTSPTALLLHWLPICEQIKYKTACMCYNVITGSAPSYLSELLRLYSPSRSLRTSPDTRMLEIQRFNRKTHGFHTFSHFGPHIWNNLPQDIRHSATLSSFKSQLKTFLFSEYFS